MDFNDPQLRKHYERVVSLMTSMPENLRPICALLDACGWFVLTEGEQSSRVNEALKLLAHPDLRNGLKEWYSANPCTTPTAISLHHTLERIVGENLPFKANLLMRMSG